ncbi:hypothetical protein BBB57_01710 [Kosakonia sacchari]|uniref:Rap1a/Tai family immunity protein n=1 Tax=Kosakonia sacchari TaxID=1158459 RepID=UPI000807586D|nr:Rap1a/Tai family immunity protein [Kosakonia sacchari]ANR77083.1 hypothetical protein BBB57_01710 [Kosakonia sacchari]
MRQRIMLAGLLFCSALSWAEQDYTPRAQALPQDDTANFLRDPALLTSQDVNMSGERFFNAWTSKSNERERIKADLYLLGVLDTTEGTVWCSYRRFKSITLHEIVYSYFRSLPPERLKQARASSLIIDAMTQHHGGCEKSTPSRNK